jgi:hypothetical protein
MPIFSTVSRIAAIQAKSKEFFDILSSHCRFSKFGLSQELGLIIPHEVEKPVAASALFFLGFL